LVVEITIQALIGSIEDRFIFAPAMHPGEYTEQLAHRANLIQIENYLQQGRKFDKFFKRSLLYWIN
jgi:hypothetical protein